MWPYGLGATLASALGPTQVGKLLLGPPSTLHPGGR